MVEAVLIGSRIVLIRRETIRQRSAVELRDPGSLLQERGLPLVLDGFQLAVQTFQDAQQGNHLHH